MELRRGEITQNKEETKGKRWQINDRVKLDMKSSTHTDRWWTDDWAFMPTVYPFVL